MGNPDDELSIVYVDDERIADLNRTYRKEAALYTLDFDPGGFQWIDCNDNRHSVISFLRRERKSGEWLVVVANFTPQSHAHYKVGVPMDGYYAEASFEASPWLPSVMGATDFWRLTLSAAYLLFLAILLFRPQGLFGRRQT